MDDLGLEAQAALSGGDYLGAVTAYTRAAQQASADGNAGMAGIFLGYGVNCALLGGIETGETVAKAEEAVALARQSGMPGSIVLTLNALALALVDHNPARARAVLSESIELGNTPGEEIGSGLLTASLVAGRLRDWDLALTLCLQTLYLWRWSSALLQLAPCLALCARALAEDQPRWPGYCAVRPTPRTDAAARPNRRKQAQCPAIPTSTSLSWPYAKPVILYPLRSATSAVKSCASREPR